MCLRAWLRRATHSTVWSVSCLFLLPLLLTASVEFNPVLVKDINPGGDSFPDFLTSAGDSVYFYADTGQVEQFFVANAGGAAQLTSLPNGTGCILEEEYRWPVVVSDAVYFSVASGSSCTIDQVWRTDGTPAGTQLVKQFTGARSIHAASKGFFALGVADGSGPAIWYSDGTAAGTRLVQDGVSYDDLPALGVLDDQIYVLAYSQTSAYYDIWRAGVDSATLLTGTPLSGYVNGAVYQNSVYIANSNGKVWRLAAGSDAPVLWQDGSKFYGSISRMYTVGDRLYLIDWDTSRPVMDSTETLWRYDGAADQLDEIATYSQIRGLAGMGDSVYFAGKQWSDPPLEGTVLLRLPLTSATPAAVSPEFALTGDKEIDRIVADDAAGGGLLYMRVSGPAGWEVWASDGSAEGTRRVASITDNLNNWGAAACPCLAVADGTLYFDRKDAATGVELWRLERINLNTPLYLPHIVR